MLPEGVGFTVMVNVANSAIDLGKTDEASQYLQDAQLVPESDTDPLGRAHLYQVLAHLRLIQNRPLDALRAVAAAIQLYDDAASFEPMSRAYRNACYAMRALGDFPEAARFFHAATALRQPCMESEDTSQEFRFAMLEPELRREVGDATFDAVRGEDPPSAS